MTVTLFNFCSEEDKKKLLNFRSASELLPKGPAAVTAKVEDPKQPAPPVAVIGCPRCEYAGDYIYPGASGRKCVDRTFCPARIYGNLALFQGCLTRLAKLKEKRGKLSEV